MGTSTDGQICFGVAFEEDHEFPWSNDEDLNEWWKSEIGIVGPIEIWTPPIIGITDDDKKAYCDEKREWILKNPIPVVEVNYCSCDYPMIILATPSSVMNACRGDPKPFTREHIKVVPEEEEAMKAFFDQYGMDYTPSWWLSSYWG